MVLGKAHELNIGGEIEVHEYEELLLPIFEKIQDILLDLYTAYV